MGDFGENFCISVTAPLICSTQPGSFVESDTTTKLSPMCYFKINQASLAVSGHLSPGAGVSHLSFSSSGGAKSCFFS